MDLLRTKLERNLQKTCEDFPGVMGIGVKSLESEDEIILINGEETFPIGSSIKIPILIEFYKKVESGSIDSSTPFTYLSEHGVGGTGVIQFLTPGEVIMPLKDYAMLMINVSDNIATNILIDLLNMEDINKTIKNLGLQKTILQRKMMDWNAVAEGKENISTPREAIELMDCIFKKRGLSQFVCDNVLNVLKKPKTGAIRNSVPDDIEVADKSGSVEGVLCDIGIVFLPRKSYAVAVMTKHIPISDFKNLNTESSMRSITKIIHNYFEELSIATIYGRRVSRK